MQQPAGVKIRTEPKPNCLLCGSTGGAFCDNLSDRFFDTPGLWNSSKCPNPSCGLIWLNPAPIEADLHLAYETYFTHTDGGEKAGPSTFRERLYKLYQFAQRVPGTFNGLTVAKARNERMFLDGLTPGKLLDVGCGDGRYLDKMRKEKWTVDGLDFDQQAIATAKTKYGLNLRHGSLHDAKFADNSFDAVTMRHVIEHVPKPVEILSEIRRILKPGGRLVVSTPNSQSLGMMKFKEFWFGVDAPRHLQIFSLPALNECARLAGFKSIQTFSTAANADIFLGGSYSTRDNPRHLTSPTPPPHPVRTIKAAWLQHVEHIRLRNHPECGEEAVLVCVKDS